MILVTSNSDSGEGLGCEQKCCHVFLFVKTIETVLVKKQTNN